MPKSIGARGLLFGMFICTLGQVVTTLAVIGVLANTPAADLSPGAGLGPVFCAAGSLVGAMLLPWLRGCLGPRSLAWTTVLATCGFGAGLWTLAGHLPVWLLVAIAGVASSGACVVLNYCLGVSVYSIDAAVRHRAVVQRISLSCLVAQAIGPLLAGWLLDASGLPAIAGLLAAAYLVSAASVTDNVPSKPGPRILDCQMASGSASPAAIALFMAVISTFGMNWYFAATLSYFSGQQVPSTILGSAMSAIQVAAILGAGLAPLLGAAPGAHVRQLFLSSVILFPVLVALHACADPGLGIASFVYLLLAGALTGIASALTTSIKFISVGEGQFADYQRRLSVFTLCAALGGSLAGSFAMVTLGWKESLMACAAACLLLGMRHGLEIKRLYEKEATCHVSTQ